MEALKALMKDFDPAALMPNLSDVLDKLENIIRLAVMIAPLVLLGLGLLYLLAAPKEANYKLGYRFFWGMSSVEAWRFSQRLAGGIWCLVGLGLAIWMALAGPKLVDMALLDRMGQMAFYIFCQAMALLLSRWIINLLVFLRYDAKGRRRYTWAELWRG